MLDGSEQTRAGARRQGHASSDQLGTPRADQGHEEPDESPEQPHLLSAAQHLALELLPLQAEDVERDHRPGKGPKPVGRGGARHAVPSGVAKVTGPLDQLPKTVVVGTLRSRVAHEAMLTASEAGGHHLTV